MTSHGRVPRAVHVTRFSAPARRASASELAKKVKTCWNLAVPCLALWRVTVAS